MQWPDDTTLGENAGLLQPATRTFLKGCLHLGQRVWPFAKRGDPQLAPAAWARRLEAEENLLLSLVQGMETEFLATGEGLMSAARQLGKIQKECQSLTDLALGQSEDAAVQFAFRLLKKAEDLVLASYAQFDHVLAIFGELQPRLAQLSQRRDELMRVLLPLDFITMAFRIEASRHPPEVQQAFFTLADSVNQTVRDVRGTLERQFDELAACGQIARNLIGKISASILWHRQEVTATLNSSRDQLRALSDALNSCQAGTTSLGQFNQAASRHINGIVVAQQCHDITHQKIEHIAQAMQEMRAHLEDSGPGRPAMAADARPFIFHAGQIQLQQVQSVFGQLNDAAGSLAGGIQNLRAQAGAAAATAVKVGGLTLDAKIDRECQAGIGEIFGIVKQAVQKIADIIAALAPLQASFVDCTGKATALASDVRHAGLNAQVYAIHAPDGATLEVLAGRMGAISEEVIQQVEQMGTALNHAAAMVNNLRQRLEKFQTLGRAEEQILTAESVLSRKKLADVKSAIPVLIQRITREQAAFAGAVEHVLANVRFPDAVAEASPRALGFFEDLVAWGGAGAQDRSDESATARKIDRLHANYTMASERHAHVAALQPAGETPKAADPEPAIELFDNQELPSGGTKLVESEIAPPATQPPTVEPAASDLGDNVELF
jgi:enamine deaminase RidA (YjgF/YER057c/UK114 family)